MASGMQIAWPPRHLGGRGADRLGSAEENCLEEIQDLLGTTFSSERLAECLVAYRAILGEIQKLRELDLADVHPVVVFDAAAAFEDDVR